MKYFVSSDIHGYYTYWQEALKENNFDINNKEHKIIICGDLFDRGEEPQEIIDFVLKNQDKIILIEGNHEDLMHDMILRGYPSNSDLHNKTFDTLVKLGYDETKSMKEVAKESGLMAVLDLYQDYYETSKYIFTHSWIPTEIDGTYDSNWRNTSYSSRLRSRWVNPLDYYLRKVFEPNKTIVSGHWHVSAFHAYFNPDKYSEFGPKANYSPFITKEFIGLDACTIFSKKVNCIVLEDT